MDLTTLMGLIGSTVYVLQVAAQVRLYGFRRWVEFGMGTGIDIHDAVEKVTGHDEDPATEQA